MIRGMEYTKDLKGLRARGRPDLGLIRDGRPTPDLPSVKYTDLYRAGDTFSSALSRLTTFSQIELPIGFDEELNGFTEGGGPYAFYNPNVRGYYGPGPTQARLRLKRMSSTKANEVPLQSSKQSNALTITRVGKFQGTDAERQTVVRGLAVEGTMQPAGPANPSRGHMYTGFKNYGGVRSVFEDMKISGVPGDWNSPPGETFQFNNYKDRDCLFRRIEIDGFDIDGNRVGGSPMGGNNSVNQVIEDCYFHDALVSSMTWSFAGVHDNIAAVSKDVVTRRLHVKNNANWQLANGQRFTGFNHENVSGKVRHYEPWIELNDIAGREWNASHMAMNGFLEDNQDIEVHNPRVSGGPPRNNGCFTVSIGTEYAGAPNAQKTYPKVYKDGRALLPYVITGNPPATIPVTPDTHFVVTRG